MSFVCVLALLHQGAECESAVLLLQAQEVMLCCRCKSAVATIENQICLIAYAGISAFRNQPA